MQISLNLCAFHFINQVSMSVVPLHLLVHKASLQATSSLYLKHWSNHSDAVISIILGIWNLNPNRFCVRALEGKGQELPLLMYSELPSPNKHYLVQMMRFSNILLFSNTSLLDVNLLNLSEHLFFCMYKLFNRHRSVSYSVLLSQTIISDMFI